MNVVILAGGGGTRLWPLSRRGKPKQFQKVLGDATLLEMTRDRLAGFVPAGNVFYSVTAQTAPFVRALLSDVHEEQFIIEPEKRDTGPAMGFVAALLALRDPDEPVVFVPSDHFIANRERFLASLRVGEELIRETGALLDIGVVPTWPNTDLGYTHVGERRYERNGIEVLQFLGHTEKPPREQAEEFLASGEYLWHANYYMWTPRKFLAAYEEHLPEAHALLRTMQDFWKRGERDALAEAYRQMPKVSIDYAITEKLNPKNVLVIKAPFDWDDIGLWSVVKRLRQEHARAVVVERAQHVGMDTENVLIVGKPDKVVATVGLRNLAVIDTDDALLLCPLDRVREVRRLVEKMQEEGLERFL